MNIKDFNVRCPFCHKLYPASSGDIKYDFILKDFICRKCKYRLLNDTTSNPLSRYTFTNVEITHDKRQYLEQYFIIYDETKDTLKKEYDITQRKIFPP